MKVFHACFLFAVVGLSEVFGLSDYAKNNFRKEFGSKKFISVNVEEQYDKLQELRALNALDLDRVGRNGNEHHYIATESAMSVLQGKNVEFKDLTEPFVSNVERKLQQDMICNNSDPNIDCFEDFHATYQTYDAVFQRFDEINDINPILTSWETIGLSYEGREIKALEIGNDGSKQVILYSCAIHAREWITPMFCVHMAEQLLNGSEESNALLERFAFALVPITNPDGYIYSMEVDPTWRKTRKPTPNPNCIGADPNRNFAFCWGGLGVSRNECSDIYPGESAFDQNCTAVLRDYADAFDGRIIHYGDVHSYGSYLLSPISYTPDDPPPLHLQKLEECNAVFAEAAFGVNGETFTTGGSVFYEAAGVTQDHFYGDLQIVFSYTYEARGGGEEGFDGFYPPAENIKLSNAELYTGMVALVQCIDRTEAEIPTTGGNGFLPPNEDCQNISSWEELDAGCIDVVDNQELQRCSVLVERCDEPEILSICPITCQDPLCIEPTTSPTSNSDSDEGGFDFDDVGVTGIVGAALAFVIGFVAVFLLLSRRKTTSTSAEYQNKKAGEVVF